MSSNLDFVTPAELGRELGHNDGKHAGITVHRYLRMRYPDRPKGQRWRLDQEEANDVRLHFSAQLRTTSARRVVGAEEQMSTGAATVPATHALINSAIDALTGERWAITDAVHHVPAKPGLYASTVTRPHGVTYSSRRAPGRRSTLARPRTASSRAT